MANLPYSVDEYIEKDFLKLRIRIDGEIIIPDNSLSDEFCNEYSEVVSDLFRKGALTSGSTSIILILMAITNPKLLSPIKWLDDYLSLVLYCRDCKEKIETSNASKKRKS